MLGHAERTEEQIVSIWGVTTYTEYFYEIIKLALRNDQASPHANDGFEEARTHVCHRPRSPGH